METASWTIPIQTLIGLEIGDEYNLASTAAASPGDGPGTAHTSPTQSHKRNASVAGFDSSPASLESPDINGDEHARDGRRRPVKRACNECRQQKVSHYLNDPAYLREAVCAIPDAHQSVVIPPLHGEPLIVPCVES